MEHELIDWYDKKGKYMGIIDKSIAHEKGLWHKSVHVWIINDKNQLLLQKRSFEKKFFPNFWDCSFAGHIGVGETSLVSAIREGEEELGLRIESQDLKFLFTIKEECKWDNIDSKEFVDVYLMRKNVDLKELTYQKEEVEATMYFDMNEVFKCDRNNNIFPHIDEYRMLEEILVKGNKKDDCI